jgi:hypothetical protein
VWQDDRVGSGVYAQNITEDGQVGPVNVAALTNDDGLMILQGLDQAVLRVRDAHGAMDLCLFDMSGRCAWQHASGVRNGLLEVTLPELGPGTYVVRYLDSKGVRALRWSVP